MAVTVGALCCLVSRETVAAPPPIPTAEDLDAQAERFRQEYSVEKRSRDQSIAPAPIESQESPKNPAPGPSFVLKGVRVTGMTIFDPKRFDFIWKLYVGKTVNFIDLNNIARLINRIYTDLGYLTTKVYLPPQDIEGGIVEIRVVEGKMGDLKVEGNKWFSSPSIEKYFHTYRGEVLQMGEMEKDVMRLNQNKDLNVSSILSPGEDPETVDVTLKAKDVLPYHVSVGTDNQGTRLTGDYRRLVSLNTTNLTGNEDSLAFNGAYTDLSQGDYLSYQTPVGTYGTKAGIDAGYFQGKLGEEYKPYDIVNYTEFYDPNTSFALYQSEDAQLDLRTGMKIEHDNKKQAIYTVTDENLRLPYLALDAIKTDSMGQTSFSPQITFEAPGFLGGSRSDNLYASRSGADAYFAKYDQYINRTQNMPWGSYIQIRTEFQTASHTLPTSEEMQLGGESSVRGYPEGDYLADIGGDMETEWYFPMYLIPSSWRVQNTTLRNDIEPFVFYDMGGGKLIELDSGETREQFLSGTGAGIRIHINNNIYLKLEWAVATGDKPIHGNGPSTFDVAFQVGT